MAKPRYFKPKHIKKFADQLRRRPVKHELIFLRRLTRANIASFDIQVRIGFYIADFVFPTKMLIIELDGSGHDAAHDKRRDAFLSAAGFTVWRIPNSEVSQWPLSRIIDYERSPEGRTYKGAINWANRQHDAVTAQRRGATPPPPPKGEIPHEEFYRRLIIKTAIAQEREETRKASFVKRIRVVKATR